MRWESISLDNHIEQRPLWSLASLDIEQFEGLPIQFSMTPKLQEIQQQMLGQIPYDACEIPADIQASLAQLSNRRNSLAGPFAQDAFEWNFSR